MLGYSILETLLQSGTGRYSIPGCNASEGHDKGTNRDQKGDFTLTCSQSSHIFSQLLKEDKAVAKACLQDKNYPKRELLKQNGRLTRNSAKSWFREVLTSYLTTIHTISLKKSIQVLAKNFHSTCLASRSRGGLTKSGCRIYGDRYIPAPIHVSDRN